MVSFKHTKVSGKADGADSTLVRPTDWNSEHTVVTAAENVVLGRAAGAGPGAVTELPMNAIVAAVRMVGEIVLWSGSTVPPGWLFCDGAVLVRTDYPALVAVIGGTYNIGGEAGTQFRLPDLRGRVAAGVDGGAGRLPGWGLASAAGAATHVLSLDEMPYHNHIYDGAVLSTTPSVNWAGSGPFDIHNGRSTSYSGRSYAHNNIQPTLMLNYMIKAT